MGGTAISAEATRGTEPGGSGGAADRLARSGIRLIAVGTLIYPVFLWQDIIGQFDTLPPWCTPVFFVGLFAPPIGMFVASSHGIRAIRRAVAVSAAAYLSVAIMWFVCWRGEPVAYDDSIWIATTPVLAVMATAIVWRPRAVLGFLLVSGVLTAITQYVGRENHGNNPFALEVLFMVWFSAIFTAATIAAMRTGRTLDATAAAVGLQAATSAAVEAKAAERRRFDALIHDGVMATFLGAARYPNSPVLSKQALSTLAQFDRLRSGSSSAEQLGAHALVATIRAVVSDVDDSVTLEVDVTEGGGALVVSADIARALAAGAAEAVRNVARHAGGPNRAALCVVHVTVGRSGVRVDVVDDGVGFDPTTVPPERLGLQISIRGRFDQIPGGWSAVRSLPGKGTRVSVGWQQT